MKLKELKDILNSHIGNVQFATVWDVDNCTIISDECSTNAAIHMYGEANVIHIGAFDHKLVIEITRKEGI